MPLDYEELRRTRAAEQPASMSDWDAQAAAQIAVDRAEYAAAREEEAHTREREAFELFCVRKAETAGNDDDAGLWDRAAETIKAGKWPVHRRISSDPEITRWQGVRTKLLYLGQTQRLDD